MQKDPLPSSLVDLSRYKKEAIKKKKGHELDVNLDRNEFGEVTILKEKPYAVASWQKRFLISMIVFLLIVITLISLIQF